MADDGPLLFDSHCHLDSPELAKDLAGVLARARAAGVRWMVNIGAGYGPDEAAKAVATAEAHEDVWATIGVHPHDAEKITEDTLDRMTELARNSRKVVAWGEIGLDYHYDHSPREVQRHVFRSQLEIALDLDLPVSLHVREAAVDTMVILRDFKAEAGDHLRGVWHCFTEEPEYALEAIDLGFYVSIPGIVTFGKADNVRRAAVALPLDRLLIETDSPYLAPIPHRGKTNEPAFVVETAKKIAELKGVSFEEVARATAANARAAYELDRDRSDD
jgi:TatD DNase family protein